MLLELEGYLKRDLADHEISDLPPVHRKIYLLNHRNSLIARSSIHFNLPNVLSASVVAPIEAGPINPYFDAFKQALSLRIGSNGAQIVQNSSEMITISAEPCAEDGEIELSKPLRALIAGIYQDCLPAGQGDVKIKEVRLWDDQVGIKVDSPKFRRNETDPRFFAKSDNESAIYENVVFNMTGNDYVISTGNAHGSSMWIIKDGHTICPYSGSRERFTTEEAASLIDLVSIISRREHSTITVHGHKSAA